MDKTLEYIKEMLEEELKSLRKKPSITPEDVKIIREAVCAIKDINELIGMGGYSEGINRSPVTGRYISNGTYGMNGWQHYSGHSINDRMVDALERMYDTASSEHEKQVVSNWIKRIRSEQ